VAAPAKTPAGTGYASVHPNGFRNGASSACGRVRPQISARFFSKASDTRADLTRKNIGGELSPAIWWLVLVKAVTRGRDAGRARKRLGARRWKDYARSDCQRRSPHPGG
jgi:hypothetical protein